MNPLLKKLNFKDQNNIVLLNAPDSLATLLKEMKDVTTVTTQPAKTDFLIAFVTSQSEVNAMAKQLPDMIQGDGIVWFCYPKLSSKKYKSEINRDYGWDALGAAGYEGVRQVAIDEDWSALRFRNVDFIKNLTRSFAITERGKKRSGKS